MQNESQVKNESKSQWYMDTDVNLSEPLFQVTQSVGQSKILQAVNTTSHHNPCVFVQW